VRVGWPIQTDIEIGCARFEFTPPDGLVFSRGAVEVRRSLDAAKLGRRLPPSIVVHRRVARVS
jgi:hypothetical protein